LDARLLDPPFAAGAVMLGVAEEMMAEQPPITLPRGYFRLRPLSPGSFSVSNIQSERGLPMAKR
jgi:hypothetical protein